MNDLRAMARGLNRAGRGLAVMAAVVTGCPRPRPLPPPPACDAREHPAAIDALALRWGHDGWVAVFPDGPTLTLREFTQEGAPRGEALALTDLRTDPERTAVAPVGSGFVVAAAPRGGGDVRLQRVLGREVFEPVELRGVASGELAMVLREEGESPPVGLFIEEMDGVRLHLVDDEGNAREGRRCEPGVSPRAVASLGEGWRAARVLRDASTGLGTGIELLSLDARCRLRGRTVVWTGPVLGRGVSIATDREGVALGWTDRENRGWIALVGSDGAMRWRPRALETNTRAPRVVLAVTRERARRALRVVALRANEVEERALVYDFTADGDLRDVGGIGAGSRLAWRYVAPDPWGGALVGWTVADPTNGATLHVGAALVAMRRVCP